MLFGVSQIRQKKRERAEEKKRKARINDNRRQYDWALECVQTALLGEEDDATRRGILDYAIVAVKRDLIGAGLTDIFYRGESENWWRGIPVRSENKIAKSGKELVLCQDFVLAVPWDFGKLPNAVRGLLSEAFDESRSNYTASYYPEIDLGMKHHSAVVIAQGKSGIIKKVTVEPLTSEFSNLDTDGGIWLSREDQFYQDVADFRFALLYTLAKWRERGKRPRRFPYGCEET